MYVSGMPSSFWTLLEFIFQEQSYSSLQFQDAV